MDGWFVPLPHVIRLYRYTNIISAPKEDFTKTEIAATPPALHEKGRYYFFQM